MKVFINVLCIIALALILVVGGCLPAEEPVEEEAVEKPFIPPPVPVSRTMNVKPANEDVMVVSPAFYQFNKVPSPALIDTWTSEGYIRISAFNDYNMVEKAMARIKEALSA